MNSLNTLTADHSSSQANYLTGLLHEHVVNVVFIKADGTERIMNCTLRPDLLPEQTESTSTRKSNPDVMSVWDLDNAGWRSFRLDSIITFTVGA
jgi:hypothetical protein